MKGLSITGFIISILIFLLAMYLQFVVVPSVASLERMMDSSSGDGFDDLSRVMWGRAHSMKVNLGMITLFGGILPLILCVIPALKIKNKLAWVGVVLSLVAVFIGLLHGTHMFS
ncbi:MAG: hypothetical protein IPG89_12505 [Bacteroidetes bacterium]|nr:hypothetical protein [Bacteroidota bacterium]